MIDPMIDDAPFDLLVVGETLVDFVPLHRGRLRDAAGFELHSGGAPGNVAIGASRLGASVGFLGVVGDDEFGWFIRRRLTLEGVDVSRVRMSDEAQTGLCFITLDADGERSFLHRGGDAHSLLAPADVDPGYAARARAMCFSSGVMRTANGAAAIYALIDACDGLICSDPGTFPRHWGDPLVLHARLMPALKRCHVVKCSSDETLFLTDCREPEDAAQALVQTGAELAVVTCGPHGAVWARRDDSGRVSSPDVEVVDTTGAGDAFMAALLMRLSRESGTPAHLSAETLEAHLSFACAIGAAAVTRRGAVSGVPRLTLPGFESNRS